MRVGEICGTSLYATGLPTAITTGASQGGSLQPSKKTVKKDVGVFDKCFFLCKGGQAVGGEGVARA
ncbi:MAG: hypothetical protein FRX49_13417 [Trebouxia sp. A1-2]|nr:MAG: hypothetical protein FRX49_13417 [Trebouxia sp. A1-2]